MRVTVLGSAAGGGFPQWNCGCRNCSALRAGRFRGTRRTQAQIAITENNRAWFLLGASPDIHLQIESCPELHARRGLRQSPISGVVLSCGDLDHVLGLLMLRELQTFRIYASPSVHHLLREENRIFAMLNRVPDQALWTDINPGDTFALAAADGSASGLICETIPLSSRYPAYVDPQRAAQLSPRDASFGIIIQGATGTRLAYMPAVSMVDGDLLQRLESTDVLFFDGTFWSDDELNGIEDKAPTAREMGHMPVSSAQGSLHALSGLRRPRKIFIHINNTNPILDESSPEYRQVMEAGWEIAEDGCKVQL